MKKKKGKQKKGGWAFLPFSILLVFCILAVVVGAVSRKISKKMSEAAIQNVSESLDLIQCTIEAILQSEVEFQLLIAKEIARESNPQNYIRAYERNRTMAKLSLILSGKEEGISSDGGNFTEEGLDFSAGGKIAGMPVSKSYVNYMGALAYTINCQVIREGEEIGTL